MPDARNWEAKFGRDGLAALKDLGRWRESLCKVVLPGPLAALMIRYFSGIEALVVRKAIDVLLRGIGIWIYVLGL